MSAPATSGLMAWLLDDEQPSVVYHVLRDVLGEEGSDERQDKRGFLIPAGERH